MLLTITSGPEEVPILSLITQCPFPSVGSPTNRRETGYVETVGDGPGRPLFHTYTSMSAQGVSLEAVMEGR